MKDRETTTEYAAFISYAHEDEAFAKLLETEIEAHPHPLGAGAVRVFRDRSDFTGSGYESALEGHLRNSASLIVICSPEARKSPFVGNEIRRFAALHDGSDRIFPILVSGLPNNETDDQKAFPEALIEVMQAQGMPLGAEYRRFDPNQERVNAGRFEGEWYKLLANVYKMTPADIRDRDKQRKIRTLRKNFVLIAIIAGLLLIFLAGAIYLWQRAKTAEVRAERAEKQASEMSEKAQTELALERAEKQASEMSEKAQTELALHEKAQAEPVAKGPTSDTSGLLARVYFHIRSDDQRSEAANIKNGLEGQNLGLVVPGIERLDVGPTRSSELRYFREVDRSEAERIGQALRKLGVSDLAVKYIPGYENSSKIRPRHFELWLKPGGAGGT